MFKIDVYTVIIKVFFYKEFDSKPCCKHLFILTVKIVSFKILFDKCSCKAAILELLMPDKHPKEWQCRFCPLNPDFIECHFAVLYCILPVFTFNNQFGYHR